MVIQTKGAHNLKKIICSFSDICGNPFKKMAGGVAKRECR